LTDNLKPSLQTGSGGHPGFTGFGGFSHPILNVNVVYRLDALVGFVGLFVHISH